MKLYWYELAERTKNFHGEHGNFLEQALENEFFFTELGGIVKSVITDLSDIRGLTKKQILRMAFSRTYDLVTMSNVDFKIFDRGSQLYESVFNACFFTALCIFIHTTKRLSGMSISDFIARNSPRKYANKYQSHFDLKKSDELKLRKMRSRLLAARPVYIKRPEWSAMPMTLEHEWSFYYTLDGLSETMRDTFKRIGNLNNDVNKVINSDKDEGYEARLDAAFRKFSSKLKKINYEDFLELQNEILIHILKDNRYYGFNIYRFERSFRLCIITSEVRSLLGCKNKAEESAILAKSVALNGIHFPKLYQGFSAFDNPDVTAHCAKAFTLLLGMVVTSSRLVIDALVDGDSVETFSEDESIDTAAPKNGYFGPDWEKFFIDTINKMTESVFYDPAMIDYTVASGSQEKFRKILSAPVSAMISALLSPRENQKDSP